MLTNRSMPSCTVIPILVYEDIDDAVEWLCDTFGFAVRWRGERRAQLAVGDGAVLVTEQRVGGGAGSTDPTIFRPPRRGEVSHSTLIRVEDVNRHYADARQRGARILQAPTDHAYGERQYTAEDFAGHRWSFSQSIADVAPEEWGATSAEIE